MNDAQREITTTGVRYSPVLPPADDPAEQTMRGVFGRLYAHDAWLRFPGGDGETANPSRSGTGSNLAQTAALRRELPGLLARLGVRSLLDIPCGDLNWMSRLDLGIDSYLGADIVPEVVEQNRRRFAGPGRDFQVLDLTRDPLPKADLVFSRDCLVHFGDAQVAAALANVKRSGATYLATTTFTERTENAADIETGGWRSLNLCRPPFSLPAPLHVLNEECTETFTPEGDGQNVRYTFTDKSIAVWPTSAL